MSVTTIETKHIMNKPDSKNPKHKNQGAWTTNIQPSLPYVSARAFSGNADLNADTTVVVLKVNELVELCAASRQYSGADVLRQLENRIKQILPKKFRGYKLFRTGFLFAGPEDEAGITIKQWIKKLINLVEAPLSINGETVNLTTNIGIARATDSARSIEDLIDQAKHALLSSDSIAGSHYSVFDTSRAQKAQDEVTLTQELYRALEENELTLNYQPVISLEDSSIVGAEALIRWDHPERGFISPGEFIPLAEKTGQIIFIDRWVLEETARQVMAWKNELGREIPLGVNISAWQFRDDFLVEKVERILKETGLPPHLLKIEITETSVMNDTKHAAEMIRGLKDLGIKIALDDFGTGHASFEYLSEFSIDELKIDRSFLDFDDVYAKNRTLVDVMIQTGKRVDLDILAEGIETVEQHQFVKNRGCEKAQGFLFNKPMPSSDFSNILENGDSPCFSDSD